MKKKVLYISYNGMLEPLGESQVLAYIKKMHQDYDFYLISLEKIVTLKHKDQLWVLNHELEKLGIKWFPLKYRHSKSGKIYNFFHLLYKSRELIKKFNIRYIHARAFMPALISFMIKKNIPVKYLFDVRSFSIDERADINYIRRNAIYYSSLKKIERKVFNHADGFNLLSENGKKTLLNGEVFGEFKTTAPMDIIPTCVDTDRFIFHERDFKRPVHIGYIGNAGGWYDFTKTLEAIKVIEKQTDFRFIIYNEIQQKYIIERLEEFDIPKDKVMLESIDHKEMPEALKRIDVALFYIHPYFSKKASAATKLGELWSSGIPVITNSGIGDHDIYIKKNDVGKIIDFNDIQNIDFRCIFDELLNKETSIKCREFAIKAFSLNDGVKKLKSLYENTFDDNISLK